jgi:pimeloyl-ACP methyl ester carboxylesterase
MEIKPGNTALDTLVDVGGCHLNFSVIQGSEGVVVLEVGGGADSAYWGTFPTCVARETGATVVTYDRAGFGKSDLPETPYDMVEEVDWCMEGLRQLGLDRELILAGHSYGGWLIRLTASRYPQSVCGMVFIDPFTTEFVDRLGVDYIDSHPMCPKDPPFAHLLPEEITKNQRGMLRVVREGVGPKAALMRDTVIPDVPVRIITAGIPWWPESEENQAWRDSHERLAASVKDGRLLVAERSTHLVPSEQPEIIVAALAELVRMARQEVSSQS